MPPWTTRTPPQEDPFSSVCPNYDPCYASRCQARQTEVPRLALLDAVIGAPDCPPTSNRAPDRGYGHPVHPRPPHPGGPASQDPTLRRQPHRATPCHWRATAGSTLRLRSIVEATCGSHLQLVLANFAARPLRSTARRTRRRHSRWWRVGTRRSDDRPADRVRNGWSPTCRPRTPTGRERALMR